MHWILRPESTRETFFRGIHGALKTGGTFVFEMGGLGNVPEMRATFLAVVGRRVGMEKAREADPWFFPDEVVCIQPCGRAEGGCFGGALLTFMTVDERHLGGESWGVESREDRAGL